MSVNRIYNQFKDAKLSQELPKILTTNFTDQGMFVQVISFQKDQTSPSKINEKTIAHINGLITYDIQKLMLNKDIHIDEH